MTFKLPNFNTKFLKDNAVTLILVFLVGYYLMMHMNPVDGLKEGFMQLTGSSETTDAVSSKQVAGPGPSPKPEGPAPVVSKVRPHDEEDMEFAQVGAPAQKVNLPACSQFVSSNLLPKDDPKLDQNFTEFSPAKDLQGQDFIDTNKYAIGMQSQTLRNANHQLRSDPPIANTMECASPWNNTTIDKEARRPLNIGSAA
jgi:hypothetical protein